MYKYFVLWVCRFCSTSIHICSVGSYNFFHKYIFSDSLLNLFLTRSTRDSSVCSEACQPMEKESKIVRDRLENWWIFGRVHVSADWLIRESRIGELESSRSASISKRISSICRWWRQHSSKSKPTVWLIDK
jgi:hypothetical protein